MSPRRSALIAMLAAALAYLPVLRAEFVWDDKSLPRVEGIAPASARALVDAGTSAGAWMFRPATAWSILLEESINRRFVDPGLPPLTEATDPARARVPHALSLLLHVLATGVVTLLAAELLGNRPGGGLGRTACGLIFALHPIHVENVAWVAARADTLATLFFVTSLLALIRARRSGRALACAAAAGTYFLALLSKENAAVGVVLAPLALRAHPDERVSGRPLLKPVAIFGGVLGTYLALRGTGGAVVIPGLPPDLGLAATQLLAAAAYYVQKIVVPWPLTPLQVVLPGPAATASLLGGALAALALAVALHRRGERISLLSFAWFALGCLPVLLLTMKPYVVTSVAERYLYLPSVGFALAGGVAVAALPARGKWRRTMAASLCALLAAYGITSWWSAATIWRDDLTLFSTMTRRSGSARSPTAWINLAFAYRDRRNAAEAERCYLRALGPDVIPNPRVQAEAWYGLGKLRQAEAEELLASGRELEAAGRYREVERCFMRAMEGAPESADFRAALALVRMQLLLLASNGAVPHGSPGLEEAEKDIAEVARLAPGHPSLPVLRRIRQSLADGERDLSRH